MIESTDKGLPLLKPTFFKDNDPKNPKYIDKKIMNKNKNKKKKRK